MLSCCVMLCHCARCDVCVVLCVLRCVCCVVLCVHCCCVGVIVRWSCGVGLGVHHCAGALGCGVSRQKTRPLATKHIGTLTRRSQHQAAPTPQPHTARTMVSAWPVSTKLELMAAERLFQLAVQFHVARHDPLRSIAGNWRQTNVPIISTRCAMSILQAVRLEGILGQVLVLSVDVSTTRLSR